MATVTVIDQTPATKTQVLYDQSATPPIDGGDVAYSRTCSRPNYIFVEGMDATTTAVVEAKPRFDAAWYKLATLTGTKDGSANPADMVWMRDNVNYVRVNITDGPNVKVFSQD